MRFEPAPANDFRFFCNTYYERCRARVPRIEAIAAKWTFEDLIPGLSDFDARFVCRDGMTADDWTAMSRAVGEVHLELCNQYPRWARILEHLPGINLTWEELLDPITYYPEYKQWTFYRGRAAGQLGRVRQIEQRPWGAADEYFFLKRFLVYYGPYNRKIDPAVNMGAWESKYPLHSRIMHYFNPAVQAVASILCRETIRGKFEAFRVASDLFPERSIYRRVTEIVDQHYEVPQLYEEPALTELEEELHGELRHLAEALGPGLTLIRPPDGAEAAEWKRLLAAVPVDPALLLFDNAKFSRLMEGRLRFYARVRGHFDSTWPIQNELLRIGTSFFRVPFAVYWQVTHGEKLEALAVVDRLEGEVIMREQARACREFARLTPGTWAPGTERDVALQIADVYDPFLHALHTISEEVKKHVKQRRADGR